VSAAAAHRIAFGDDVAGLPPIDIAIVATNADRRAEAVRALLGATRVRLLVLEKLLFDRRADYAAIAELIAAKGTRAWVNCTMGMVPAYERIKAALGPGPVDYRVTGSASSLALVTNAIHYLAHVVHLTGCESFAVDTAGLDAETIASKRAGFRELTGTLAARFADGSRCIVTSYPAGTAPVVVEISNGCSRAIVRESEGRAWQSVEAGEWKWQDVEAPIPFQSVLTTWLVDDLLARGDCALAPFATSVGTHLQLLDPLLAFVRERAPETATYPFT
jgi:predicted dehydrogenase